MPKALRALVFGLLIVTLSVGLGSSLVLLAQPALAGSVMAADL